MSFAALGFHTIAYMGSASTTAGTRNCFHSYVTNDDAATVETANYFDSIIGQLKTGDLLMASIDLDGTPVMGIYQVTVSGGHVTIKTASGSQVTLTGAAMTENTGAIGGTNDGNLPALAMSVAWNGSSVYPSAADSAMLIACIRELAAAINKNTADILALKNAL